jgi:hypothetical protein
VRLIDGWSRIRICLLRRACSPWPAPTPASAPSHAPSPVVANNHKFLSEQGGILSFKNLKWAGFSFAALGVAISGLESI